MDYLHCVGTSAGSGGPSTFSPPLSSGSEFNYSRDDLEEDMLDDLSPPDSPELDPVGD